MPYRPAPGLPVSLVAMALVLASSRLAAAQGRPRSDNYATFGMDTAFLFGERRDRVDMSYFLLMTPRAHFAVGRAASLSVGVGLPGLQLLALAAGEKAWPLAAIGPGLNVPIEVRLPLAGRAHDSVLLMTGVAPLLQTAVPCVAGSGCDSGLALAFGGSVQAGLGYQLRSGAFVNAAFSIGHLFSGPSSSDDALSGMYRGFWLGFGFPLGG